MEVTSSRIDHETRGPTRRTYRVGNKRSLGHDDGTEPEECGSTYVKKEISIVTMATISKRRVAAAATIHRGGLGNVEEEEKKMDYNYREVTSFHCGVPTIVYGQKNEAFAVPGSIRKTLQRRRKKDVRKSISFHLLVQILALLCCSLFCIWAVTLGWKVRAVHSSQRQAAAATSSALEAFGNHDEDHYLRWSNPHDLVHVVQTRFMQFQPNLLSLGRARLELFQALTIPSMLHQTSRDFLWIIRTDPDLHDDLKLDLMASVSAVPNAVLVASNENPEGFRDAIGDITEESVLAGSWYAVESYHHAGTSHTVLETRLDADDAVSTDFVQLVQETAAHHGIPQKQWRVWCAENHVEWQYDSPWSRTNNGKGALLGVHTGLCITPGLTWGYGVGTRRSDMPKGKHTNIHKLVPACDYKEDGGSGMNSNCLIQLGGALPLALRARTPTSAGMENVLIRNYTEAVFPLKQLQKSKWKDSQDGLWESLHPLFGVEAADLWSVRHGIEQHIAAIAKDALDGQCTKGHSCKQKSRKILEMLIKSAPARD